jgi:phosphoribosylanthranilate isomerase
MQFYPRTRVKICGITRPEDALVAAQFGADAIGLVFYQKSPRSVTIEQAQIIMQALPAFVTTVGLFVNAKASLVYEILAELPLDLLQFHGDELPEYCQQFAKPYIKALRMSPNINLQTAAQDYTKAKALLLDTYVKGVAGGTGKVFDWQQVPANLSKPIILAGGLNPDNVNQAISTLHPYAVDVSGGVESSKGIKNADKIAAFIKGVQFVVQK